MLSATNTYVTTIHYSGRNDRPRKGLFDRHHCYQLIVVSHGSVELEHHGSRQHLRAPAAFLLPPASAWVVDCPAGSTWEYVVFDLIAVPLELSGNQVRKHKTPQAQPGPMRIWGCEPPVCIPESFLSSCLTTVHFCGRYWWLHDHGWARANARLHAWVTDYALAYGAMDDEGRFEDDWLRSVYDIAEAGVTTGLTAKELADTVGMSLESLRMRLRRFGISPGALLQNERLRRAGELLSQGRLDVKSVARLCGYRSVSAFSAAFKDRYHQSPGEWRRQLAIQANLTD